ncbi:ABC transporter substrate-binding protein [Hymenobacter tibetensis]|uniref:ABC transporter substrate-binding protein n=1 Tax=Hymenobacter tibetensis TaxID=497967 RepID=A0ABY4CSS7_9BACT|nr:ABC transporter substrate-binding protein [Hymenobacter tibetensis]UOG73311.1 ABC transporter substrate-binding protein [Hymenobacter tibetensis]
MPHSPLLPGRAGDVPVYLLVCRSVALLGLLLLSPAGFSQTTTPPKTRPKVTAAPATRGRTTVQYAKGFTITYAGNCKVVTILSPFEQKTTATRYLLVPRGTARPAGYPDAQVITTPIRSLVGLSSMHVALASFLGADDILVGLGNFKYASSPRVRQRITEGKIYEVGQGKELNNEQLIARHPDLVMTTGWPGENLTRFQTLAAAGIPVMINSEWVEKTPLARAEWVKVLAVLLNKEDVVNQKFGQVAREYQRLATLGQKAAKRPRVVVGMPFKDVWHVPDTDSYMAQFLRDAGTTYAWDKTKSPQGSLALSFETVSPVALTADYWLHTGSVSTKAEVVAQDARYAAFASFKSGRVYNNNRRTNAQGANDYWESGAVRPDLVLADLLRILHPELLPAGALCYYQQLK